VGSQSSPGVSTVAIAPGYPGVVGICTRRDGGTVALPQLTDEQRAAALEKAAAARKARAELKERLKRGGTDLKQVLKDAEEDEILGKMKVSALLEALPKVGKVKAQEIMTELEIAPTRRLRGLGDRQRKALLARFDFEA
jgi:transposase